MGARAKLKCFNSLMVRLKVQMIDLFYNLYKTFQFLDGAIKRNLLILITGSNIRFQFLDGAIKSFNFLADNNICNSFQFLDGAIKSLPAGGTTKQMLQVSIP